MKKIIIDFKVLKTEENLNLFLESELELKKIIPEYGYNFAAFLDTYGYLDDNDVFKLKNYNCISDIKFKERATVFINEVLESLKETNPNFNYVIID